MTQISAGSIARVWAIDTSGNPSDVTPEGDPFAEGASPYANQVQMGHVVGFDAESVFDESQSTHLWIVRRAATLANSAGTAGQSLYNLITPQINGRSGAPFHDQMCQGLYDADFNTDYNDPVRFTFGLRPTWKSHFYDASTGKNYKGETSPTALTRGREYFWAAVEAYMQNDMSTAGYNLGLSLHYFTDLCQPMHSGNFTFLDSHPALGYHTDFETAVMEQQSSAWPPGYTGYSPVGEPGELFIAAAQYSKDTFYFSVCPVIVFQYYKYHSPSSPRGISVEWNDDFLVTPQMKSVIANILQNAVIAKPRNTWCIG